MTAGSKIRVAAVQAASVSFDLAASVEKVSKLVSEAKAGGAQLVVLPEAFLSAYPRHWGFAIGGRTEEQREWFARYVQSSVMVPEDAVGREWMSGADQTSEYWAFASLGDIAKRHAVYLSIGIVERSIVGSTLWCTNLIFSRTGVLLAKHRKLQPTAAERVVWSQGEGKNPPKRIEGATGAAAGSAVRGDDNIPVVKTELGRMGGLICWENFMPLGRYVLYKKGVELYLAPTADARPTWLPTMQHIAQEGRCFVISANQYHSSLDFPADYPPSLARGLSGGHGAEGSAASADKSKSEVWSRGGSCIVGPLGEVLAGPLWDKEGVIYADVDVESLIGARLDFDPAGHYSREDVLLGILAELH